MDMEMKQCKTCGALKAIEEFYRASKGDGKRDGTCKECRKVASRIQSSRYFQDHRPAIMAKKPEREQRYTWKLRQRVFTEYGGRCVCCGDSCIHFLQMTHPDGRYAPHVTEIGYCGGHAVCWYLERNNYPEVYRLLCANCLRALGSFQFCPHQGLDTREQTSGLQYRWALRCEVLAAYGGKCTCCGEETQVFLEVDHPQGDGGLHRRMIGIAAGQGFYRYLKREKFPRGMRLLCSNCNTARGWYGFCPHVDEIPEQWRIETNQTLLAKWSTRAEAS